MSDNFSAYPRMIRPAPEPLGLYFRAGRNDRACLLDWLASGNSGAMGCVVDPTLVKPQRDLIDQLLSNRLDAVLDPRTQASATIGGHTPSLGDLPWGRDRPHTPADFKETAGRRTVNAIADFVTDNGFTQVLAPTHFLRSPHDEWLDIDIESTRRLRNQLDRTGGQPIPIIYSLATNNAVLRDEVQRHELIDALKGVPMSQLWLKVDGFGSDATASAIRNYLAAAADFHELGVPVVADHVGGLAGLSLLAFGAVGGISHGITQGERFSSGNWFRKRAEGGFGAQRRVYVPKLDLMLKPEQAQALLNAAPRAKGLFGCTDSSCCPRGITDMLANPERHFLNQRVREIATLSQAPETLRPKRFLEDYLRPTTDAALFAANIAWQDDATTKKFQANRKRLDSTRIALSQHVQTTPPRSFAHHPKTRAARETRVQR